MEREVVHEPRQHRARNLNDPTSIERVSIVLPAIAHRTQRKKCQHAFHMHPRHRYHFARAPFLATCTLSSTLSPVCVMPLQRVSILAILSQLQPLYSTLLWPCTRQPINAFNHAKLSAKPCFNLLALISFAPVATISCLYRSNAFAHILYAFEKQTLSRTVRLPFRCDNKHHRS